VRGMQVGGCPVASHEDTLKVLAVGRQSMAFPAQRNASRGITALPEGVLNGG